MTAAGAALALGSIGVTVTSALYALSPPAAALPAHPFDQALAGARSGARTMYAAGTVGIFSDIVAAVGAMLVRLNSPGGRVSRVCRSVAILLSIVVFTFVERSWAVLAVAAMADGAGAFTGFKRLFDVLFLLGTASFGVGAMLALTDEIRSSAPIVASHCAAGMLIGLAALCGCGLFRGYPLETSVASAALPGAMFLGERLTAWQIAARCIIAAGAACKSWRLDDGKSNKKRPGKPGRFSYVWGRGEGRKPSILLEEARKLLLEARQRPPRSSICWVPPVQAGCDLKIMSKLSLSPSLPQVERV